MKLLTFQIYDSKADAYLPPFEAINEATAARIFQLSVIDPNTMFFKHPGDFSLMETGNRDQSTGICKDNGNHIDHGTARQHQARYDLANPQQDEQPKLTAKQQVRENTFGKTITNGDALRLSPTKETTPS